VSEYFDFATFGSKVTILFYVWCLLEVSKKPTKGKNKM